MTEMAQCSLSLAVIIIGVFFISGVQTSFCPDHVNRVVHGHTAVHNNVCYLFVNKELYWGTARDACWDLGGEMLTVELNGTMDFIKKILASRELAWNKNGVWLGANELSGIWRWTNGKVMTYSDWAKNQPKTFLGTTLQYCALMRRQDGWKWHNSFCSFAKFRYNYICQFPLNKKDPASSLSADQAQDKGDSQILTIFAAICGSLLLVVVVVFLALFLHRRHRKLNQSETASNFSNHVYHMPSVRRSHPVCQAQSLLTLEDLFPHNDDLYMTPSEVMQPNDLHNNTLLAYSPSYALIQTGACNCMPQSPNVIPEFKALNSTGTKLEPHLPLMADVGKTALELTRAGCANKKCPHCSVNKGEYIDMRINGLVENQRCTSLENKKHIYSNVDHRDGEKENHYEVVQ